MVIPVLVVPVEPTTKSSKTLPAAVPSGELSNLDILVIPISLFVVAVLPTVIAPVVVKAPSVVSTVPTPSPPVTFTSSENVARPAASMVNLASLLATLSSFAVFSVANINDPLP